MATNEEKPVIRAEELLSSKSGQRLLKGMLAGEAVDYSQLPSVMTILAEKIESPEKGALARAMLAQIREELSDQKINPQELSYRDLTQNSKLSGLAHGVVELMRPEIQNTVDKYKKRKNIYYISSQLDGGSIGELANDVVIPSSYVDGKGGPSGAIGAALNYNPEQGAFEALLTTSVRNKLNDRLDSLKRLGHAGRPFHVGDFDIPSDTGLTTPPNKAYDTARDIYKHEQGIEDLWPRISERLDEKLESERTEPRREAILTAIKTLKVLRAAGDIYQAVPTVAELGILSGAIEPPPAGEPLNANLKGYQTFYKKFLQSMNIVKSLVPEDDNIVRQDDQASLRAMLQSIDVNVDVEKAATTPAGGAGHHRINLTHGQFEELRKGLQSILPQTTLADVLEGEKFATFKNDMQRHLIPSHDLVVNELQATTPNVGIV